MDFYLRYGDDGQLLRAHHLPLSSYLIARLTPSNPDLVHHVDQIKRFGGTSLSSPDGVSESSEDIKTTISEGLSSLYATRCWAYTTASSPDFGSVIAYHVLDIRGVDATLWKGFDGQSLPVTTT